MLTKLFTNRSPLDLLMVAGVLLASFLVPLVTQPGASDAFREPKLILFRAIGLTLAAIITIWHGASDRPGTTRNLLSGLFFAALILLFASAVLSDLPSAAAEPIATFIAGSAYIVATKRSGLTHRTVAILVLVPALVNVAVALGQELLDKVPFGLAGNRNDLSLFLVLPLVISLALLDEQSLSFRLFASASAVATAVGLAVAGSTGAIVAALGGVSVLIVVQPRRRALATIGVVCFAVVTIVATVPDMRAEFSKTIRATRDGNWHMLLSGRPIPYRAAASMIGDHPMLGVGPGRFAGRFLEHKVKTTPAFAASALLSVDPEASASYDLAHSDHLQIAAEGGILLWILSLVFLVVVASRGFEKRGGNDDFSRRIALPVSCAVFILAIGQFPLHTGGSLIQMCMLFGLILRKPEDDIS